MNSIDFNILENKENAHILLSYSMYLDKLIMESLDNNSIFEMCISLTELYNSSSNSFDMDTQLVIKSKMELCYATELFVNKVKYKNICITCEELKRSIIDINSKVISSIEKHIIFSIILMYINHYKPSLKTPYLKVMCDAN